MSAKRHRGAPELTCGTLWVTCDNSPTFDGTGPQNAPEGTVDMAEYVMERAIIAMWRSGVPSSHIARWMETHHDDIPALKAEYAAKLALRGDE